MAEAQIKPEDKAREENVLIFKALNKLKRHGLCTNNSAEQTNNSAEQTSWKRTWGSLVTQYGKREEARGKIGVLTWKHSECAILVDFCRQSEVAGPEAPLRVWYDQELKKKKVKKVHKKVGVVIEEARRPSEDEVRKNSRSRSAVLHVIRSQTGVRFADLEKAARPALGWKEYQG